MLFPTRHPDARRPRRVTRLAAAAGAALLLTACGTDDPDDADSDMIDDGAEVTDPADEAEADLTDDEVADADEAAAEAADADETDADETDAEADADADDADDADDAPDAPAGGTLDGELVVAGTAYEPQDAIVCEDDGAFPMDVQLEYQAFAEGPDGAGQLDVFISDLGADVSWSGEEGVFGDGLSNSDITFTGDRVSGTATVTDALGSEETMDISFDLAVPSTTIACRG